MSPRGLGQLNFLGFGELSQFQHSSVSWVTGSVAGVAAGTVGWAVAEHRLPCISSQTQVPGAPVVVDSNPELTPTPRVGRGSRWRCSKRTCLRVQKTLRDASSILGSGRSPGGGHGNPLQHSCLENPMEPGRLQSTVSHRAGHDWSDLARTHTHHELGGVPFPRACPHKQVITDVKRPYEWCSVITHETILQ